MGNDTVELIVVLNGNFIPIRTLTSNLTEIEKALVAVKQESVKEPLKYIKFENVTIFGTSIQGWYWREPLKNPQQEMLNLLKKEMGSDEPWKNEE